MLNYFAKGRFANRPYRAIADIGGMFMLLGRVVRNVFRGEIDRPEFFRSVANYGSGTLAITFAASSFVGMLMVLQSAAYVEKYGAQQLVGWFTGFTTLRELGPVVIALMFSGRIGASHAAELAAMVTHEQMDALKILALDVVDILIAPRMVAMVFCLVLLVAMGNTVALLAGSLAAWALMDIAPSVFFHALFDTLGSADFVHGLWKSSVFAVVIGWVSSYQGLCAARGASAVAQAVNRQVVLSAVGIFFADYAVTMVMP